MKAFSALARQHLREQRLPILIWAAMVALISSMVAGTAPAMAQPQLMEGFLRRLPAPTLNLIGRPNSYLSLLDYYIAFKWLGLMPLVGSVFGATAALAIIAKDIDRKSADFPLSLPVSRTLLLTARFTALAVGLSFVFVAAFVGLWLRMTLDGLEGSHARYAVYFVGCYSVALAFSAGALLISLTLRTYGAAARCAILLVVAAYLLDVLNRLIQGPEGLGWLVLYGLARTENVIGAGVFPVGATVSGLSIAALFLWLSTRVFASKQIPA